MKFISKIFNNDYTYIFCLILINFFLFIYFHLQWINLQHDVGREMYQAFAIASGLQLYTEVGNYFGPIAPIFNANFLKLLKPSVFNFSLIGLLLTIFSSIMTYSIGRHFLNRILSFSGALLFLSNAAINIGGGSFFMPYTFSHSYGIALSLICFQLVLKLTNNSEFKYFLLLGVFNSFLIFTKQEYIIVSFFILILVSYIIIFDRTQNNIEHKLLTFWLTYLGLTTILYFYYFDDYTIFDWYSESVSMFREHNDGILRNFLMLYSPSTLWIAFQFIFPITSIILSIQILTRFKELSINKKVIPYTIGLIASLFISFLFKNNYLIEYLNRSFFLNWLTLSIVGILILKSFNKKILIPSLFLILGLLSMSFYSRQQSASWMWQGLNWLILLIFLTKVTRKFEFNLNTTVYFSVILIIINISLIPYKLNQGIDAVSVTGPYGDKLSVKKDWSEPIQELMDFSTTLPENTTVYCGQESGWINVMIRRFNYIRYQQWWGYIAPSIINDMETKGYPDFIIVTRYKEPYKFRIFGNAEELYKTINQKYKEIRTFQNDHIKIEILKLND